MNKLSNSLNKDKLLWLAKRLKGISEDLECLTEEDKQLVIEQADRWNSWALKELYNTLNEYME